MDLTNLLFEKKILDYCLKNTSKLNIPDMSLLIIPGAKEFPIWSKGFNELLVALIYKTTNMNKLGQPVSTNQNFSPILSNTEVKIEYLYQVHQLSNRVNKLVNNANPADIVDKDAKANQKFNLVIQYANKLNKLNSLN